MAELVFVKLGGSVITDKQRPQTPRPDVIQRAAEEIAAAVAERPDMRLLLGHGSGSFGHCAAARHGVREGGAEGWLGYADTAAAAARLNRLVADALLAVGLPVVSVQPSATARCYDGALVSMDAGVVASLLERDMIPLVYGDVALDAVRGCTVVSTEQIFTCLARRLRPARIIMVGEVDGLYTADPHRVPEAGRIPEVRAADAREALCMASAAYGVDVTGGMAEKVRSLLALVGEDESLTVHLVTGMQPGLLHRALCGLAVGEGTVIRA